MAMETILFGVGAAGNKAAITVLKLGILPEQRIKLLNTTTKDIPDEYKNSDMIVTFNSGLGGCGKEPSKGRKAMYNAIVNSDIDLGSYIEPDTKQVILVTSTEGGTGCGAVPVIAQYFDAMNIPTHIFAFVGFQDEARGINNTLKFFKELSDNVILHTIQNDYFKDYTGSYSTAEEAANVEFARQVEILLGSKMVPSTQNIDDTDHYKISTTPGYMDIKHVDLTGCKNVAGTNTAITEAFDNGCNLDYIQGCKRLAIIINASESVRNAIDEHFEVIKRYTGEPFETYRHIQDIGSNDYMDIIISGLAYPEKSMIDMKNKYEKLKEKLNTGNRSFADIFGDINMDDDDEFDMEVRRMNKPEDVKSIFTGVVSKKPSKIKEAYSAINNVIYDEDDEY